MKSVILFVVSLVGVGCASERAIWQAQDNIIQNDNRIAEAIGAQHASQAGGDIEQLRAELDQLLQANAQINDRTKSIAEAATSAQSVAADAMSGVQAYLGSLGGPIGGAVARPWTASDRGSRSRTPGSFGSNRKPRPPMPASNPSSRTSTSASRPNSWRTA